MVLLHHGVLLVVSRDFRAEGDNLPSRACYSLHNVEEDLWPFLGLHVVNTTPEYQTCFWVLMLQLKEK
jgi:hypothetical protein